MRLHISLEDELIAELDRHVRPRERSSFIAGAVRHALEDIKRRELIESAIGSIPDAGHEWDDDPAAWVRAGRHADSRRVG